MNTGIELGLPRMVVLESASAIFRRIRGLNRTFWYTSALAFLAIHQYTVRGVTVHALISSSPAEA